MNASQIRFSVVDITASYHDGSADTQELLDAEGDLGVGDKDEVEAVSLARIILQSEGVVAWCEHEGFLTWL